MNIPEEKLDYIKPFLSHFNKYKSTLQSKKNEKQLSVLLMCFYNDIQTAFKKVELLSKSKPDYFKGEYIKTEQKKIPSDIYTQTIIPDDIKKYIIKNEKGQLVYRAVLGGRPIKIIFALFQENEVEEEILKEIKKMYTWLLICDLYASKMCTEILTIYVYKTPFNKKLPTSKSITLSGEHMNTAYTFSCISKGEIVIYRNEEWFKVFIHETFHTFGLDFSGNNNSNKIIQDGLMKLFPIKSDFNIYEAYTETWARIINCCFYVYTVLENKSDKKQFIINTTFCLELERMFTLYQCNKVLRFMGLKYKHICGKGETNVMMRKNLYK